MAIIVDKVQKRRDIALACTDLILEKGMKKLTVAEVARTAGVAKGSIYDYFENKEDIVFEVIRNEIGIYQEELYSKIENFNTTREKVFELFGFLLEDNEWNKRHQNFYKEYMSIDLSGENKNMSKFNFECSDFFKDILTSFIKDGIANKELKEEAINFVDTFIAIEKGYLILSWTEDRDMSQEITTTLNSMFDLLEVKN